MLDWFNDGAIIVVDLALACCAVESEFAVPEGAPVVDTIPDHARVVVVVSGTLTDAVGGLAQSAVQQLVDQVGSDRVQVISFGACASAGGPYWDSYSVTKGVDQLVLVAHYIAGCPPPPSALANHLDTLHANELPAKGLPADQLTGGPVA